MTSELLIKLFHKKNPRPYILVRGVGEGTINYLTRTTRMTALIFLLYAF